MRLIAAIFIAICICFDSLRGKYPPAKPVALCCEPLKAASRRRLALSRFLSLLLHLFLPEWRFCCCCCTCLSFVF